MPDGGQPAKPIRTWRPMVLWSAGIVLALGLVCVFAAQFLVSPQKSSLTRHRMETLQASYAVYASCADALDFTYDIPHDMDTLGMLLAQGRNGDLRQQPWPPRDAWGRPIEIRDIAGEPHLWSQGGSVLVDRQIWVPLNPPRNASASNSYRIRGEEPPK